MSRSALTLLVFLGLLTFGPLSMAQGSPPATDVLFIAQHLDVLSFPNSIGPRRRPEARTLMDYGFTQFKPKPGGVESEEDGGGWYFAVELATDMGDTKVLCITDEAANGGTYHARYLVKVKLGKDGLFHATERPPEGNNC
jgi:hypothetical protein